MQIKTIKKAIENKLNDWLSSITDESLVNDAMSKNSAKIVRTKDGRIGVVKTASEPIKGKVPVYLEVEKPKMAKGIYTMTFTTSSKLFKEEDLETIAFID